MESPVRPEELLESLLKRYPATIAVDAWGETSIFYNPGRRLPRGVYFATVKQKDGDNDRASQLDRPGVFRFNAGTSRALFVERFGLPPPRPAKGKAVEGPWEFTRLDEITPHPVYGWMSWIAVLNPSRRTLNEMNGLVDAAYEKAKSAFDRKVR